MPRHGRCTRDDAERCLKLFRPQPYGKEWQPVPGVHATLSPSGHMAGSSFVRLDDGTRSILFSGDIGRPSDPVLKPPSPMDGADYLVVAVAQAARIVESPEESERLNGARGPMIIIAASGMATGGRVVHHLKAFAPDRRNTVLFAGYQAGGTRGATIAAGAPSVRIHGQEVPVRAEVAMLDDLSAHADANEILRWLAHFKRAPKQTFITHGEPAAADALRQRIERELRWRCHLPCYLESVDLD